MKLILVVFALCLAICCNSASAWSHKEHIQFTRIAIHRLLQDPTTPPAMKKWLEEISPKLLDMKQEEEFFLNTIVGDTDGKSLTKLEYFVIQPDLIANKDKKTLVEPFGVPERLTHFIDLELFLTGERVRGYRHDLSGKPKIEDIPNDPKDERYKQAGVLPMRVQQCYDNLVVAIKAGKLMPADINSTEPTDNALRWAAYLAHYLGDNTQPHHATLDFKSATYFADKNRPPNVHAEMEYRMGDDAKDDFKDLREAYWPLFVKNLETFKDPADRKDLFRGTLQVAFESYDALPLIGLAAMKATNQAGTPEKPTGKNGPLDTRVFFNFKGPWKGGESTVLEMKAHQTAWAVLRIQTVLRQAWEDGTK